MNHQHSRSRDSRSRGARRGGFTLVEIIVVLVIITLISSIVFAAFKSIREGNKKTSCQTNMVQIYQALRLYGQDFSGQFPAYNPVYLSTNPTYKGAVAGPDKAGMGLWSLYAYPTSAALDCDGRTTQLPLTEVPDNVTPPLASYIKSPTLFHCPYDDYDQIVVPSPGCDLDADATLNSSQLEFTDKSGRVNYNPFYNSYQTVANYPATQAAALDQSPYSSFRTSGARRQLVYWESGPSGNIINPERRTPDTTVITWCRFHRKTDKAGLAVEKPSNSDNVLFMDGTVQFISTKQEIGPTPAECETWKRVPQETAASLSGCPDTP